MYSPSLFIQIENDMWGNQLSIWKMVEIQVNISHKLGNTCGCFDMIESMRQQPKRHVLATNLRNSSRILPGIYYHLQLDLASVLHIRYKWSPVLQIVSHHLYFPHTTKSSPRMILLGIGFHWFWWSQELFSFHKQHWEIWWTDRFFSFWKCWYQNYFSDLGTISTSQWSCW